MSREGVVVSPGAGDERAFIAGAPAGVIKRMEGVMANEVAQATDSMAFQGALAQILVNPKVRGRFLKDPQAEGERLGLNTEQVEALKAAGLEHLRDFAHSLVEKRVSLVNKSCPCTYKLLTRHDLMKQVIPTFITDFLPEERPEYPTRAVRDGLWLTQLIIDMIDAGTLHCRYLRDVALCEHIQLRMASMPDPVASAISFKEAHDLQPERSAQEMLTLRPFRGTHSQVEAFSCNVVEAMRHLSKDEAVPDLPEEPTLLLFTKLPGWRQVRFARVNALTHQLLDLCDGSRSGQDIVDIIRVTNTTGGDPVRLQDNCLKTLDHLYKLYTITFDLPARS